MLPYIADESLSDFVPDRLITNNVLIVFETFHWLQKGSSQGEKFMAVKLDMSKAYDRIEWGFLKWILNKLCFPPQFCSLIMSCVQTVSFQVLMNGFPTRCFKPCSDKLIRYHPSFLLYV